MQLSLPYFQTILLFFHFQHIASNNIPQASALIIPRFDFKLYCFVLVRMFTRANSGRIYWFITISLSEKSTIHMFENRSHVFAESKHAKPVLYCAFTSLQTTNVCWFALMASHKSYVKNVPNFFPEIIASS